MLCACASLLGEDQSARSGTLRTSWSGDTKHALHHRSVVMVIVQVSRGLLPDVGSEYEGAGGDITDAVDFLLVNFTEMNKLWVRMQHQGSNRDK